MNDIRDISVIPYLRKPTHIGRQFGMWGLLENQSSSRLRVEFLVNMADSTSPYKERYGRLPSGSTRRLCDKMVALIIIISVIANPRHVFAQVK